MNADGDPDMGPSATTTMAEGEAHASTSNPPNSTPTSPTQVNNPTSSKQIDVTDDSSVSLLSTAVVQGDTSVSASALAPTKDVPQESDQFEDAVSAMDAVSTQAVEREVNNDPASQFIDQATVPLSDGDATFQQQDEVNDQKHENTSEQDGEGEINDDTFSQQEDEEEIKDVEDQKLGKFVPKDQFYSFKSIFSHGDRYFSTHLVPKEDDQPKS